MHASGLLCMRVDCACEWIVHASGLGMRVDWACEWIGHECSVAVINAQMPYIQYVINIVVLKKENRMSYREGFLA